MSSGSARSCWNDVSLIHTMMLTAEASQCLGRPCLPPLEVYCCRVSPAGGEQTSRLWLLDFDLQL